jgi:hypothetical protein
MLQLIGCADDSPLHYRFQAAGASNTATISVGLQGGGDAAMDGIKVRLNARAFCLLSLSCTFNRRGVPLPTIKNK